MTIKDLYQSYYDERKVKMTEEQFITFAVFFPTLLVIISDGVVDMEEWEYVKQLARFMAKSFKDNEKSEVDVDELTKTYLYEISFLLKFQRDWQATFIEGLKEYVRERPEVKSSILDTIELFAEASDGTSDDEQEKIDFIKKELSLQD